MRLCPKCGAENKDANAICANCQAYIGNVLPTRQGIDASEVIDRQQRKGTRLRIILLTLFLGFFLLGAIHFFTIAVSMNVVGTYLLSCLLYLPGLFFLLAPLDRIWGRFRSKPMPDTLRAGLYFLGVVLILCVFIFTFDVMKTPN